MNLVDFLDEVDRLSNSCTKGKLVEVIHDIARVYPNKDREDFLIRYRKIVDDNNFSEDTLNQNDHGDEYYADKLAEYLSYIEDINEGETGITAEYNELYDDWYSDIGDEFIYIDEKGIGKTLEEMVAFIRSCRIFSHYCEGFQLAWELMYMKIPCFGDYDLDNLSFHELGYYDLISVNEMGFLLDTLLCAYYGFPADPDRKMDMLYDVFSQSRKYRLPKELTLEEVMQYSSRDLDGFDEFLPEWIDFLGSRQNETSDTLVREAVGMTSVVNAREYAQKYADTHPNLYLDLMKISPEDIGLPEIQLGLEAIKNIPDNYIIVSIIALQTADFLNDTELKSATNNSENAELYRISADISMEADDIWVGLDVQYLPLRQKLYYQAFHSETTAVNYFRCLLNGFDATDKRSILTKEIHRFKVMKSEEDSSDKPWRYYERMYTSYREENEPSQVTLKVLRFLDGEFSDALNNYLNYPRALGWSGTFMKIGISLFLLAIYEGDWDDVGIHNIATDVRSYLLFTSDEYHKGCHDADLSNDMTLFEDVFKKWKELTPMDDETKQATLLKISNLLERRVQGVMDNNKRKYYAECACYISALGAVRESLGESGAKQTIMTQYRDTYPRRSSFIAQLEAFGWRNPRKR